jgi:hypothetical protein
MERGRESESVCVIEKPVQPSTSHDCYGQKGVGGKLFRSVDRKVWLKIIQVSIFFIVCVCLCDCV